MNARAPRFQNPRDRYARGPRVRAGLLVSRQMDFGELGDVEALMTDAGLTLAPMSADGRPVERPGPMHSSVTVLPTAGVADIEEGRIAMIVAPDAVDAPTPDAASGFDKLVNTAHAAQVPIMAFGEGAARALAAMGYEAQPRAPAALLIHKGVRILETVDDVRDALRTVATPQTHAA